MSSLDEGNFGLKLEWSTIPLNSSGHVLIHFWDGGTVGSHCSLWVVQTGVQVAEFPENFNLLQQTFLHIHLPNQYQVKTTKMKVESWALETNMSNGLNFATGKFSPEVRAGILGLPFSSDIMRRGVFSFYIVSKIS